MGKRSRDKGARAEREFAKLISGERVPLSGAAGGRFAGDVVGLGLRWECKRRANGFRQLYGWLENADALAVRADRREWLIVIPLERFMELLERGKQDGHKQQNRMDGCDLEPGDRLLKSQ